MKRLIWAFVFVFPFLIEGQNKNIYFSSGSPEFVPYGKSFDLYTNVKFPEIPFDEVYVYIYSDKRIPLQDLYIYNNGSTLRKKTEETDFGNYSSAYRFKLSAADTLFDFSSVFRLRYSLAPLYEENISISYAFEFLRNHKVYTSLSSLDKNSSLSSSYIKTYRAQQAAGRCLLLQEGGELTIAAEQSGQQTNLLAEFWIKVNNLNSDFLRLINGETGEDLFSIGLNNNYFIYMTDRGKYSYTGYSLSKNSWYHTAVYLINNKVQVYLNRRFLYENEISKQLKEGVLKISFVNESSDSYLYVKQLRIWNYREDLENCFANRQYAYFSSERSELLYQNLFNDDVYPAGEGSVRVSDASRLRTVQCDAPIISRAPDINITVFSTYCSIEWSNKDNQKPKNFIVEKSKDGNNFAEVFKTTADEDLNKVYYYSDKRDEFENITYYRVHQLNYDGSEIYSSSLKVGQSAKKDKMKVGQNYPNPFNPTTSFSVEMIETAETVINVYDLVGKTIKVIHEGTLAKGVHTFSFDGSSLPSGIYFYEIKTPSSSIIKKMILTK